MHIMHACPCPALPSLQVLLPRWPCMCCMLVLQVLLLTLWRAHTHDRTFQMLLPRYELEPDPDYDPEEDWREETCIME